MSLRYLGIYAVFEELKTSFNLGNQPTQNCLKRDLKLIINAKAYRSFALVYEYVFECSTCRRLLRVRKYVSGRCTSQIKVWFDILFNSTDRIDTLDERFIVSYLYFARREAIYGTSSEQARDIYLNASRYISRLGWTPEYYNFYFTSPDVEYYWENVYMESVRILYDTTFSSADSSNWIDESIELLQHYKKHYQSKYNTGSGYNLRPCFNVLQILELGQVNRYQGLLINEWNELARTFCELQESRMNRPVGTEDSKYVDIIREDWNKVFTFIQSSSVLNDIEVKEKEIILKLFQDKISEVQVYRDNSETKAYLEGRDRFNSMISGELKEKN